MTINHSKNIGITQVNTLMMWFNAKSLKELILIPWHSNILKLLLECMKQSSEHLIGAIQCKIIQNTSKTKSKPLIFNPSTHFLNVKITKVTT